MSANIAALIQLGHQQQQQLQQQQQRLDQAIQLLTNLSTPSAPSLPDAPVPAASVPGTPAQMTASASAPEPKIGNPERFNGDPNQVRAFLTSCRVQFSLQPRTFATEGAKVGCHHSSDGSSSTLGNRGVRASDSHLCILQPVCRGDDQGLRLGLVTSRGFPGLDEHPPGQTDRGGLLH